MPPVSALQQFLNAYRTSSKSSCTHLSLEPNGKYAIPEDNLSDLYQLIHVAPAPPHILETHTGLTAGPLLIDLDFDYPDEPRFHKRQYTSQEIIRFLESIHSAVTHFYADTVPATIEYVVSEKPQPTLEPGKRVKDGIHIVCLGIYMTYKDQHALRAYALEKHFLQNSFCMDYIRNKADAVYDKSVIETNSWYLLGCSKPGREPYLPTMSFLLDGNELVSRRVNSDCYSIGDLSIRKIGCTPLSCQVSTDILPIQTKKKTKREVLAVADSVSQGPPLQPAQSDITGYRPSFLESLDVLKNLVNIWSRKRLDSYESWRNCIFCIAACSRQIGAIDAGLKLAHDFSKGHSKYDKDVLDKTFVSEKSGILGFIVAHQWARQDNLVAYMASGYSVWWKTPWAHYTVAREFYGHFPDLFLYRDKTWYAFNGVYWTPELDNNLSISSYLSKNFYDILYGQILTQRDSMDATIYQRKLKELTFLFSKSFKADVIYELQEFYTRPKVEFNKRAELIAFENRVYDLNAGCWVKPEPDMFISKTTGYAYEEPTDLELDNLERWVGELFDSPEKTEYVLKVLASTLYRYNREEKGYFFLGRGRNGKGTLVECLKHALGPVYSGLLDISYFTSKDKNCAAANPHIFALRDSRVCWVDEAGTELVKFSAEKFKGFTGRTPIPARELYENKQVLVEPPHLLALLNNPPSFTGIDYALLQRVVCIRFPYLFLDINEYNADDPAHRKQDPRIKETVLEKRCAFIALMFKWYKIYERDGLSMPSCVKEDTREFTDSLDFLGQWFRENLAFTLGAKTPLKVVYAKYKEYCETENTIPISLEEFAKKTHKQYEIKRCRNNDEYGNSNRIINYKLI